MSVAELDASPTAEAAELLASCCGSSAWVAAMLARRPFGTRDALLDSADRVWRSLGRADWLEAFAHHPRIGERSGARTQTERGQSWSAGEQAGMNAAGDGVRTTLSETNRRYEQRFGYGYIVCASGKTAEEMLAMARTRLTNKPDVELTTAALEQQKITRLRLEKLLG